MYDMMNGMAGTRRMTGDVSAIYPTRNAERKEDVFGMEPIALSAVPAALRRPAKHGRKVSNFYAEGDWGFNSRCII